jgi:hypothetical protein
MKANYSAVKDLLNHFDGDRAEVKLFLQSVEKGLCYIERYDCTFKAYDTYYDEDEWCYDYYGNIIDSEETVWCEGLEEAFHINDTREVHTRGGSTIRYSIKYIDNSGDIICDADGDYYDDYGRDFFNIVFVEDLGEYYPSDEYYYHDSDGNWYSYPEESFVRGYHDGNYKSVDFDNKSKFRIGFEIEKEDADVRNSIDIDDFEYQTNNLWRKERDGSLDDDSGYELISPTFEFNTKKIFEHIESNELLVSHINAGHSYSCGGHIHLSEKGLSGSELFDKIKGYTPLFYALYYGRVNKNYSKGKSNRDLKEDNEKYQAIKIHSDRVEFRIISAVPNVSTLKWRCELLSKILRYPTSDIKDAYFYVDTKFTSLLRKTYKTEERLSELKNRFVAYSLEFENINIKD